MTPCMKLSTAGCRRGEGRSGVLGSAAVSTEAMHVPAGCCSAGAVNLTKHRVCA